MLVVIFILGPLSGGTQYRACPLGRYQRGHMFISEFLSVLDIEAAQLVEVRCTDLAICV